MLVHLGLLARHLRDELQQHVMDRRTRKLPHRPTDHFFGTSSGGRRDPDRFRDRILTRSVERANANRTAQCLAELPAITPPPCAARGPRLRR